MSRVRKVRSTFFGEPENHFSGLNLEVDEDTMEATIVFVKASIEHKGYFRALLTAMEASPYKVRVYLPVLRTRQIISRLGYGPNPDNIAVWEKGIKATEMDIRYGRTILTAEGGYFNGPNLGP